MTTWSTLPVQGYSIRFGLGSLEGVRQVNLDQGAKTVEVNFDPGLIGLDGTRRGVEEIGYREVAL